MRIINIGILYTPVVACWPSWPVKLSNPPINKTDDIINLNLLWVSRATEYFLIKRKWPTWKSCQSLSLQLIKPITVCNDSKPPPAPISHLIPVSPSYSTNGQDRSNHTFSALIRQWSTHQEWEKKGGVCLCVCRGGGEWRT